MMKTLAIAAALALAGAAPSVAQAPTLDERVANLEAEVAELSDQLAETEAMLACFGEAMAVSRRTDRSLYLTARRAQSHVYVLLVDRACIHVPNYRREYRWHGYTKP